MNREHFPGKVGKEAIFPIDPDPVLEAAIEFVPLFSNIFREKIVVDPEETRVFNNY